MSGKYLITGGLGYAGCWLTRHLANKGNEVFVLSRSAVKKDIGVNYNLIQADLETSEPAELAALLPKSLAGVVHAASYNEAFEEGYAQKALLINSLGTRKILEALVRQKKTYPFFIYLSTFHVYGLTAGHITEATKAAPLADYALTHFFAEEYCRMFMRKEGLPSVVIRMSNCYGAPASLDTSKWYLLLNDLCKSAVSQRRLELRSDPSSPRDFVWLGDVAETVARILKKPELAGSIFNLSSGKSKSIGEVARLIADNAADMLGTEIPLVFLNTAQESAPMELFVDSSAVRKAVGLEFHDCMQQEVRAILKLLSPCNKNLIDV